jgi:DNA (cytosine-5)-methyltransferase 1
MGYFRAGFDVVGVDNKPQPHYPFEFHLADAFDYCHEHAGEFDVIHASPPCQGYSKMRHLPWLKNKNYPLLIAQTRETLQSSGKLWVIENVSDAPLNGAVLCGLAVGLPLLRHRRFESNILLLFPPCPRHPVINKGHDKLMGRKREGGVMGVLPGYTAREATGIDWMSLMEIRQAIPPAYTELIGRQLVQVIENKADQPGMYYPVSAEVK